MYRSVSTRACGNAETKSNYFVFQPLSAAVFIRSLIGDQDATGV
jgi:hypothetical protein